MAINFKKSFKEDWPGEAEGQAINYKSKRYAKKVEMRERMAAISSYEFQQSPRYEDLHIWDLTYISTSQSEDNDSSDSEDSSDSDEDSSSSEKGSEKEAKKEEKK